VLFAGGELVVVVNAARRSRGVWERELRAKNHETERDSSVSGAPCETAVKGDGKRWWGGVDEVVVVVELCVRKREAGKRAGGQKPQNRARWLGFGCAV